MHLCSLVCLCTDLVTKFEFYRFGTAIFALRQNLIKGPGAADFLTQKHIETESFSIASWRTSGQSIARRRYCSATKSPKHGISSYFQRVNQESVMHKFPIDVRKEVGLPSAMRWQSVMPNRKFPRKFGNFRRIGGVCLRPSEKFASADQIIQIKSDLGRQAPPLIEANRVAPANLSWARPRFISSPNGISDKLLKILFAPTNHPADVDRLGEYALFDPTIKRGGSAIDPRTHIFNRQKRCVHSLVLLSCGLLPLHLRL